VGVTPFAAEMNCVVLLKPVFEFSLWALRSYGA